MTTRTYPEKPAWAGPGCRVVVHCGSKEPQMATVSRHTKTRIFAMVPAPGHPQGEVELSFGNIGLGNDWTYRAGYNYYTLRDPCTDEGIKLVRRATKAQHRNFAKQKARDFGSIPDPTLEEVEEAIKWLDNYRRFLKATSSD